jgi:hypothetical protein
MIYSMPFPLQKTVEYPEKANSQVPQFATNVVRRVIVRYKATLVVEILLHQNFLQRSYYEYYS